MPSPELEFDRRLNMPWTESRSRSLRRRTAKRKASSSTSCWFSEPHRAERTLWWESLCPLLAVVQACSNGSEFSGWSGCPSHAPRPPHGIRPGTVEKLGEALCVEPRDATSCAGFLGHERIIHTDFNEYRSSCGSHTGLKEVEGYHY